MQVSSCDPTMGTVFVVRIGHMHVADGDVTNAMPHYQTTRISWEGGDGDEPRHRRAARC